MLHFSCYKFLFSWKYEEVTGDPTKAWGRRWNKARVHFVICCFCFSKDNWCMATPMVEQRTGETRVLDSNLRATFAFIQFFPFQFLTFLQIGLGYWANIFLLAYYHWFTASPPANSFHILFYFCFVFIFNIFKYFSLKQKNSKKNVI